MTEVQFCEKHGKYDAKIMEIMGRKFFLMCPECEKEQAEKERLEKLESEKAAQIEKYKAMGIEPEFYTATLENYKAESESERQAKQACNEILYGALQKLLLLGSNGTGKTHLACALVKKMNGVIVSMFELSSKIRSGYTQNKSEVEVLDELLEKKLIVIDEVGRTKGSDAEKNWLSYLIDKAHTRHIKIVLVSNRHLARSLPAENKGESFEFFMDNDVISRLKQNSRIIEIEGRDRRLDSVRATV